MKHPKPAPASAEASAAVPSSPGEKLYTYQELVFMFKVHIKTISRWFSGWPVFRPTHNTVRVPESVLKAFLQQNSHLVTAS